MLWSKIIKPLFIDAKWSMPFSLLIILFFIGLGAYHLVYPTASMQGDTLKRIALLVSNYVFVILLTLYVFTQFLKARDQKRSEMN